MKSVAYLGIEGSNSHTAVLQYFKTKIEGKGVKTFNDIFQSVLHNKTTYGIIPIENSLSGSIYENYDNLFAYDVTVTGEHYLKFENHLLGIPIPDTPFEKRIKMVKRVVSHPQPFAQCATFLNRHPWIEKMAYSDTANAAKYVAGMANPEIAAIGNREAAALYGLDIIREYIADDNDYNYTRFLVISTPSHKPKEYDKCSIIFSVAHTPGSLFKTIKALAEAHVNLTKIESRPIHGKPFEYLFSIDFEFDQKIKDISALLKEKIEPHTHLLKILGCYKSASLP